MPISIRSATARVRRCLRRVRADLDWLHRTWVEIEHAQRRMFELQTRVASTSSRAHHRSAISLAHQLGAPVWAASPTAKA
jgi:hypothetical protein